MTALAHLVLEESYVLAISIAPYSLELRVDLALAPELPDYRAPAAGEQECYRRGAMRVTGFRTLAWRATNLRPSSDATGELDFGNLDRVETASERVTFYGDWGELEVAGDMLSVSFDA